MNGKLFYQMQVDELFHTLGSDKNGLSLEEVNKRQQKFGKNEIQKEKKQPLIFLFFKQFKDFLTYLLLAATLISLILGEYIEAGAMIGIALLSATLGFIQDYKANQAISALQKMSAPTARVVRGGKEFRIAAKDLVPGDIVILEAGDIVPADCRIIESYDLEIDEASLTGESIPSKKESREISKIVPVPDQHNMAFMSCPVTHGKAKCIVVSIGMQTEIGKIAESIQSAEETPVPLQVKFKKMAKQIGYAVMILVGLVFILTILRSQAENITAEIPELLVFALSLAVAAIPNSLPAIVTISLALGAKVLAKKKMIIKRLHSTESLGSATIICTDKTGTLTKNQMTVKRIFFEGKTIDVSGNGYDPVGEFTLEGKKYDPKNAELLFRIGYLCNNAKLVQEEGKFSIVGDPTEGSLIVLGQKAKLQSNFETHFKFVKELPFDSERKMMSVVFENLKHNKREAYVKGAPDILLERCNRMYENGKIRKITPKDITQIQLINQQYASDAQRVLALAYKEVKVQKDYKITEIEKNLVFVGLVGMIDPPREEVKEAVKKCKNAGIQVMMITGDHSITAMAVAKEIGLYEDNDLVISGSDLDKMSESELERNIDRIRILARALPIQKLRIVNALQKKNHIVAMTGDGVNDAPALKQADIGIAMGITGTEVAKEVSNAILVDDNFATIVNAVSEGRNIYDKIIKSTRYLLSCNAGEIIIVLISILFSLPLPMLPLQLLLMNLVTDGLPALALGTEPGDKNIMSKPPRDPKSNPIEKRMFFLIVLFGLIMGALTFVIFKHKLISTGNLDYARTMTFTALVMLEMFAVFASRTFTPFGRLNPFSNKWLLFGVCSSILIQLVIVYWAPMQVIFDTVALSLFDWIILLALGMIGYLIMEFSKFFLKSSHFNSHNLRH